MWKHIFTNHNFYITNCDIKLCQNKLCQNWCSQHYSYLIPIILFHSEKEGHKDRRVKSKWELAYNLTRRGNGGNHKLVMVRGGREWKLAIERSNKRMFICDFGMPPNTPHGGTFYFLFFFSLSPLLSHQPAFCPLSLSLSLSYVRHSTTTSHLMRYWDL